MGNHESLSVIRCSNTGLNVLLHKVSKGIQAHRTGILIVA